MRILFIVVFFVLFRKSLDQKITQWPRNLKIFIIATELQMMIIE